jgi:hypothetical protein
MGPLMIARGLEGQGEEEKKCMWRMIDDENE